MLFGAKAGREAESIFEVIDPRKYNISTNKAKVNLMTKCDEIHGKVTMTEQ